MYCRLFVLVELAIAPALGHAETAINAWFTPGEEITDIVAARYKFKVETNDSPFIMILFGWNRLTGPSTETYLLENNIYADGLRYEDGICTTWPLLGTYLPATASLRSAIPDYNLHGWTGARALSPLMFPRQTYLIDNITNLWKSDLISQTNLNGVECTLEVTRGGLVTDRSGWRCIGLLDTNVAFREWSVTVTLGSGTYTNLFAAPDSNARYITWHEVLGFGSEFFWRRTEHLRVFLWDLELKREGMSWWHRLNQWKVTRQDDAPVNYGSRVVPYNGRSVIEMSNIGTSDGSTPYLVKDTIFNLGTNRTAGLAPDLMPQGISSPASAFAGQTIPVIVTVTNKGTGVAPPFRTGYFLSIDANVAVNDRFTGAEWNQVAGLPPQSSVTITNLVNIPINVPLGSYHLGVVVDYPGVIVESVKTNNAAGAPIAITGCLPSYGANVTNTWRIPADFALNGWLLEDFPDTRPGGATGGGTNLSATLGYAGDLSLQNGAFTNQGPTYTANDFYPYLQLATNHHWLVAHPGKNRAASLGFIACATGNYHVTGAFGRANSFQHAGNGVAVAIARNRDTTNLLFSATIPSSVPASESDLFQGPGATTFELTASLIKGETIRFLVFNGTTGTDIGFDATALAFTLTRAPLAAPDLTLSRKDDHVLIQWLSLPEESYEIESTPDFTHWSRQAMMTSRGTNQLSWLFPIVGRFRAFRVGLLP